MYKTKFRRKSYEGFLNLMIITAIFLTLSINLRAEMYDVEIIGLGNFSINSAMFTPIPQSVYILVSSGGTRERRSKMTL